MPPLSKSVKKDGCMQRKLERPSQLEKLLYMDILESQQTDSNGHLADTLLICDGGTIRVHAFLLQMASPFFHDAITSQGENYPYIREILLPDFSAKEIENMLNLLYKGYVDLKSQQEVQCLEETLKFFGIPNVAFTATESIEGVVDRMKGSLKIHDLNRIPQDIFKTEFKEENSSMSEVLNDDAQPDGSKQNETAGPSSGHIMIPVIQVARRTGGRRKVADKTSKTYNNDPDYNPESDSSGGEKSRSRTVPIAEISNKKHQPVVKLRRIESSNVGDKTTNKPASPPSKFVTPVKHPEMKPPLQVPAEEVEVETDEEDKDWEPPNYADKKWMMKESCRCQACNKVYDKHGDALCCITSKHKALRCYFCFRVYSTTESLFRHFAKRHKPAAGREKTVMCHYCDQMVPWKSVSCHVISVHLKTKPDTDSDGHSGKESPSTSNRGPGRPSAIQIVSSGSKSKTVNRRSRSITPVRGASTSKKLKRDGDETPTKPRTENGIKKSERQSYEKSIGNSKKMLKVDELDVTISKVTASGKIIAFRIQKCRSTGSVIPHKPK